MPLHWPVVMLMGYPISFLAWPVSEAKSSAISSNVLQLKFVPEYDWHARTTVTVPTVPDRAQEGLHSVQPGPGIQGHRGQAGTSLRCNSTRLWLKS